MFRLKMVYFYCHISRFKYLGANLFEILYTYPFVCLNFNKHKVMTVIFSNKL